MNVTNKDRFPHVHKLKNLGGYKTADGEKYSEDFARELGIEYEIIMETILQRDKLGGTKPIHHISNAQ